MVSIIKKKFPRATGLAGLSTVGKVRQMNDVAWAHVVVGIQLVIVPSLHLPVPRAPKMLLELREKPVGP